LFSPEIFAEKSSCQYKKDFYTLNMVKKIVKMSIIIEYKLKDLKLNFSFLHCIKDKMGKINVKAITGNQRSSKIAPTKGKW
jgi:hypothetical protein